MRRRATLWIAVQLAVCCTVFGSAEATAQPALTPATVALSTSDLGAAWRLLFEQRIDDGGGFTTAYVNPESGEFLAITIVERATRQSPEDLIAGSIEGLRRGQPNPMLDVAQVEAPPLGEDAVRKRAGVSDHGDALTSDLIAWRSASLVVLVVLLGDDAVNALPYAERQEIKIAALAAGTAVPSFFGPLSVVAVTSAPAGGNASVTVQASPGAVCSIEFRGPEGTLVAAPGLQLPMADETGRVTWTWLVPPGTPSGAGALRITCDGAVVVVPIQVL
jgi:hypothetical protein